MTTEEALRIVTMRRVDLWRIGNPDALIEEAAETLATEDRGHDSLDASRLA